MSLQKSLVRIIGLSKNPISHTDPLFAKLAILKIDDLYTQRVRLFSYKLSRGLLPNGVSSLFEKIRHSHGTRGVNGNLFVGRYDSRSIRTIAPRCWNALPNSLKGLPSVTSFKEGSKRGLLAPYSSFVCKARGCASCVGSVSS